MPRKTRNVTVRMPLETRKKLDHIATGLDRSRNWLINDAIEHYLDVYEWQEMRIRERLKKSQNRGKFFAGEQVDKIVESFKP